jgi:hypothetical protein
VYKILLNIPKPEITCSCSCSSRIEQQHRQELDTQTIIYFNKVLVIGLGQLGLSVARYVKAQQHLRQLVGESTCIVNNIQQLMSAPLR